MAEPHHTAPSYLSGYYDPIPPPSADVAPSSSDTNEKTRRERQSNLACIQAATLVLVCLLADSDVFHEMRSHHRPVSPDQWPLSPAAAGGVQFAIHFLHQYAGVLSREQSDG